MKLFSVMWNYKADFSKCIIKNIQKFKPIQLYIKLMAKTVLSKTLKCKIILFDFKIRKINPDIQLNILYNKMIFEIYVGIVQYD